MATLISRTSDLAWPVRDELDPDRFVVTYDRLGDELLVHFFDGTFPSASFPADMDDPDYLYLLGDVETGRIVGIHVDAFLAYAVERHPGWLDLLDVADLRGITPAEVAAERRRRMTGERRRAALASLLDEVGAASVVPVP
jgi:hypothetical protein